MPESYYSEDMWEGEVVLRDRYQFELKSLYSPLPQQRENQYTLEFYFFIPNALQINPTTYSREQFYRDLTGLIRFKTPEFSLSALADLKNPRSPLCRIKKILETPELGSTAEAENELKLFGNILRSAVRDSVKHFIEKLEGMRAPDQFEEIAKEIGIFAEEVKHLRKTFTHFFEDLRKRYPNHRISFHSRYVDEFCSITIEQYLTQLLKNVRDCQEDAFDEADRQLRHLIAHEIYYRQDRDYMSPNSGDKVRDREQRTFRNGLLRKFVLDVLLLFSERRALMSRYQHYIGSFAAGVAMFIYLLLFVWQGNVVIINSLPFIVFTSILYVLKDRMKDMIKHFSARKAFEWYPDFSTEVLTHDRKQKIGDLTESFSFQDESRLPKTIRQIHREGFEREVPEARRMRNIFYYKRRLVLKTSLLARKARRYEINDIFRYNISHFLRKASNPTEENLSLDIQTGALVKIPSPKVYHINIILKQSFTGADGEDQVSYKKFRLVIDKDGIKRLERLNGR